MGQFNLNEKQREAVEHKDGDLLIIAGAGTGKTSVLTKRVINIIEKEWAKPSEILALTFTEKASNEMQERIDDALTYGYEEVWVSTFHSFCDKLLRQEGYHIGLDGDYSLMTTAQSYIFMRKNLFNLSLDKFRPQGSPTRFLNDLLKHFSRLQDEDVSPEDYVSFAKKLPKGTTEEKETYAEVQELSKVYKEYTDLKIKNSKIDFGDLIIFTLKLLREKPNVLEKYREQFKYILVDEFQDTNYTQNVLVNLLVLGGKESSEMKQRPWLTVVGDDDQAIYKFRGAAISNILQFKDTYPEAKEVVLLENYRSRQEILDKSYDLITHNNPNRLEVTEKIDKKLKARGVFEEDNDVVNFVTAFDEDKEAEWVASEILRLTGHEELAEEVEKVQEYDKEGQASFIDKVEDKKNYNFSDIAILVRANSHSESIVQNLRYNGIPFKLGGSRGLYFRDEIQNLIAFLRILTDYADEISMYKLLSMDIWNLSPREYMEVNRVAREKRITLFEELENLWGVKLGEEEITKDELLEVDNSLVLKMFSKEAVVGLSNLLLLLDYAIKKVKDGRSIGEILYDFIKESGYLDSFLKEETTENLFAVSNLQKFFDLIKNYEKDNPDTNIYEYVDYLNYCIEVGESPLVDQVDLEDLNAVNILTVHGSKGLEYPIVFLSNLVSERFPTRNRKDVIPIHEDLIKEEMPVKLNEREAHLQEERRLFYVGATRAKERLYLTAANYYGNGKRRKKPSTFLYEILDRDITEEFIMDQKRKEKERDFDVIHEEDTESLLPDNLNINLVKKLSYSQIHVYEDCPKKYEYAYVLRVPQRPSAAMSFGTTVHNTLNVFYEQLKRSKEGLGLDQPPTEEFLLDLYEKKWVGAGYESNAHEEKRKEVGREIMKEYYQKMYSPDERPYMLEEGFSVHIGETVFKGKIDRMDLVRVNEEGIPEVEIIDYKTGKVKSDANIKKDLQLPLYCIFAEEKLGVKVVGAKYLFVEHQEIVEVDVSQERREKSRDLIPEIVERISSRDFVATPGFNCKFCDYNSVCKDAQM